MDDLTVQIEKAMDEVARSAYKACDETLDLISKEALKIARDNAPVRNGDYQKSLKRTKIKSGSETVGYRIHSTESISHLLENGHLTRNGDSTVPGKPHFLPAQEYAKKNIEQEFIKNSQKGDM